MSEYKRKDELTGDPVLDHNYDGIEELDNPLPGWWLATFYLCIIFAVGYFFWYNIIGDSNPIQAEYARDVAVIETKLQAKAQAQEENLSDDVFLAVLKAPAELEQGKKIYAEKCSSCHAVTGGGDIGPNLTDSSWLYGDGKPVAIFKTVRDGTKNGMPPWSGLLSETEQHQVVAYVYSLKGSNPPKAKAPQGTKVE